MLQKKGLDDAQVNFATGEAVFTENPNVQIEQVIEGIKELGYSVIGKNEDKNEVDTTFFTIEKKLIVSAFFTIPLLLHMFSIEILSGFYIQLILCIPVFTIGFFHFGKSAFASLKSGVPNMDVLIFTGSTAAFIYSLLGYLMSNSVHESHNFLFFETSASIITLVLLGNYLERKAVNQTTSAIQDLAKLKPKKVKIIIQFGDKEKILETEINNIKAGDVFIVNSGDALPADGIISEGEAEINESFLTGESLPVFRIKNNEVHAGTIVLNGSIKVLVQKAGKDTLLSGIIELIKNAQFQKPKVQHLADKIAAIFVPVVLIISLITFLINYFISDTDLSNSILRSIGVLVISCPCAMGLATPTAVMVGIGRAAREGILIKGGHTLQQLAEVKHLAFDKTGTLTTGEFKITDLEIMPGNNETEVKKILYALEKKSSHPIAKSIVKHLANYSSDVELDNINEIKGSGIEGFYQNEKYFAGKGNNENGSLQFVLIKNKIIIAKLKLDDELKSGSKELFNKLKEFGYNRSIISGDLSSRCNEIAKQLNVTEVYAEKKPQDKLEILEKIKNTEVTAMVGDGINDAPSLATAQIGIAMGNGTDIAILTGQVVLLNGDIRKVANALAIGKATLKTIHQNLFWAFFYNIIAIPLAATGFLNPMIGAIAMALSDVMVIGNSILLRMRKIKGAIE